MDLFATPNGDKTKGTSPGKTANEPLATRMRPVSLQDFSGQEHLIGPDKLLRRAIESGRISSMIFYGPPSSGKTTLALVVSREVNARFVTLNAVLDGVKELREVVKAAKDQLKINGLKTILFVDEIHRWNKAQQDALLPHIESGLLTLIGATTENPYYSLVSPLLSRCQMFELQPIEKEHILEQINRALNDEENGLGTLNVVISDEALDHFAEYAGGDIRNALNALEMAILTSTPDSEGRRVINLDTAKESIQKRLVRYARGGDEHYHYASAFIKSMRGSDPDAALYWMCAMIEGGEDPEFIFRRMLIFASEDVGMADTSALNTVNSAHDAFHKCGMPEGMYFLSHACICLSIAPKSNSTGAVFEVMDEIRQRGTDTIPAHLRDKTASRLEATYLKRHNSSEDYKYPHGYPGHWVDQQYLPDSLRDAGWYKPGTEGAEAKYAERLRKIRGGK